MSNPTEAAELNTLLSVQLQGVYPSPVSGYYDAVKMVAASSVPAPADDLLRLLVNRTLEARNPASAAAFTIMSNADRKDMVADIIRDLTGDGAIITAYVAALQTYHDALP